MSNLIPPLLSTSPPPIGSFEENDDDEFGDFTNAVDSTLEFDAFSIPNTPEESPKKFPIPLDINSNKNSKEIKDKDYQDKRKDIIDEKHADFVAEEPSIVNEVPIIVNSKTEFEITHASNDEPENDGNFVSQVEVGEQNVPSTIELISENNIFCEQPPEISNIDETEIEIEYNTNSILDDDEDDFNDPIPNFIASVEPAINEEDKHSIFVNATIEKCEIINNDELNEDEFYNEEGNETITNSNDIEVSFIDNEDDFDDFQSNNQMCVPDSLENKEEFATFPNVDCCQANSDESDDDFGDFVTSDNINSNNLPTPEENKDFASFEKFENVAFDSKVDVAEETNEDNFSISLLNAGDVLQKSESIILNMFLSINECNEDYIICDITSEDSIFKEIKDITDTNALTYQWAKSNSQKSLLKALNIDTRNILYGAGRNSSMPKFAANLGTVPLEPVKSSIISAPSVTSQSNTSNTSDIPSAQFDWSESGLANPLDSISKEEENKKSLQPDQVSLEEIKSPSSSTVAAVVSKSFDTESVNSLQFVDLPNDSEISAIKHIDSKINDEFGVFTTNKSTDQSSWTNTSIPLRETYIFNEDMRKEDASAMNWQSTNEFKKIDNDWFKTNEVSCESSKKVDEEPGWLKPTILTPVLPRKEQQEVKITNDDDEFADFQMSLPLQGALSVVPLSKATNSLIKDATNEKVNEFAEFQSSSAPITQIVNNILQPTSATTGESKKSVSILWPDPGITEDELQRLELYTKTNELKRSNSIVQKADPQVEHTLTGNGGLLLVEKSVVVPANKVVLPSNEVILPPNNKVVISKDLVLPILESSPRKYIPIKQHQIKHEEDDWTDFMSNQIPVQKQQHFDRMSTPELPLSIPQLSNIQPPKPPIPVITPNGLMQTKIPSSMQPLTPTKSQPHINLYINPPQDGFHPAIISQQFAAQFNQTNLNGFKSHSNFQTTNIPANTLSNGLANNAHDDSDEWSDFMSSQPIPSSTNSVFANHVNFNDWNRNNSTNWNDKPNIITNPVHYHGGDNKRTVNGSVSSISSISQLPDLDFATPKGRTFYKQ